MLGEQKVIPLRSDVEIFVVDDEDDIRSLFKEVMEDENYRVYTARSINETLVKMCDVDMNKKIIFIIDYHLSDEENGVQLADELQRRGVRDGVYILITAGEDLSIWDHIRTFEEQSKIRGDCNTIDDVLFKPISMHELKEKIKKYV